MEIKIKKCDPLLNSTQICVNSFNYSDYFYLNIYFLNSILNPNSQHYLSYYLEDRNYLQFTDTFGGLINIYMDKY